MIRSILFYLTIACTSLSAQHSFYNPISIEGISPEWIHTVQDFSIVEEDGITPIIFAPYNQKVYENEGYVYSLNSIRGLGFSTDGSILQKIDAITGEVHFSINVYNSAITRTYHFDRVYVIGDTLKVVALRSEGNFGSALITSPTEIAYLNYDKNTGDFLSEDALPDSDENDLIKYYWKENAIYSDEANQTYYSYGYDTEQIKIDQADRYGRVITSYTKEKEIPQGYSSREYVKFSQSGELIIFTKYINPDVDSIYTIDVYNNDLSNHISFDISDRMPHSQFEEVRLHNDRYLSIIPHLFFGNSWKNESVLVYDIQKNDVIIDMEPFYNDDPYEEYSINYHPQLETWLLFAARKLPNVVDIYRIDSDQSMELLVTYDIAQFDHFLFPAGSAMLTNGDVLIKALHRRYPYNKGSNYTNWPTWIYVDHEQLGLTVSTEDIIIDQKDISILVSPNPASLSIKLQNIDELDIKNYKVYNINGALVLSGVLAENNSINILELASGLYTIQCISVDGSSHSSSFVKQ